MSSLTGHRRITQQAVVELAREHPNDPLLANLQSANLPSHAILRDLYDVLTLGHWLNFGQKHHFMRRFDGQKPFGAYHESLAWIRTNALAAARRMHDRIRTRFAAVAGGPPAPARPGVPLPRPQQVAARLTLGSGDGEGGSWQVLGNACHALQDSFAGGHVVRRFAVPPRPGDPGLISDILVYADGEHYKHEHHALDEAWQEAGAGGFSPRGRLAIDATKALLQRVVMTAVRATERPNALEDWPAFEMRWLAPAPELAARDPDAAIRFVQRFATGLFNGLPVAGHLTLNMDEEGLAQALVREYGTSMREVRAVFEVLDRHHNSDADDVAEIYVGLVRGGGPIVDALRGEPALVRTLIRVMDEGWTTGGEADAIRWLRTLLPRG